ncbi:MAG: CPBP family intramembrane metalloprotease [Coleofasciculaceae cyanobacterium RL_1_1]|nr:CPBP family intramembrane metalloprotease [Coleofasciculaceae cyanobacterium RL_1_1]
MTTKQGLLAVLTALVVSLVGLTLISSLQRPQIQGRLELAQTDLLLQASDWNPPIEWQVSPSEFELLQAQLIGEEFLSSALKQYEQIRRQTGRSLDTIRSQQSDLLRVNPEVAGEQVVQIETTIDQLQRQSDELELNIGVLQTQTAQIDAALENWQLLTNTGIGRDRDARPDPDIMTAANVVIGLWETPPLVLPNAEESIRTMFHGWFRDRLLTRLYTLQDDRDRLDRLAAQVETNAGEAVQKLAFLSLSSLIGLVSGLLLSLGLIVQRWRNGETALLAHNGETAWTVTWDWEAIAQAVIGGFFVVFFLGQFVSGGVLLPQIFTWVGANEFTATPRGQAASIFVSYVLSAIAALSVIYVTLKPFFPLGADWLKLRLNWRSLAWGVGGYLCAIPAVIGVSLVNQYIWNGQGGSNPILEVALASQDWWAIGFFLLTAAVAAPIFEEIVFRGFLLPSLTRYVSVNGAIALSALTFACAHLSLSEVLPLTTLGIVLGVVYTRSRSLFAVMLLHALWNSNTLLSLVILGSGTR